MGRHAQHAWIIRVFAIALAMAWPALAFASATAIAPGVALNASAGCTNGNLDITLATVGANREFWHGTNAAGATLTQGEAPAGAGLANFSGTFFGFKLEFLFLQPIGTLIGSYAYVGETPPDATNTAEFFVFYKCSLTGAEVLLTCFGRLWNVPADGTAGDGKDCRVAANPRARTVDPRADGGARRRRRRSRAGSPPLKRERFRMHNGEARESGAPSSSCVRAAGCAYLHWP